MLSVFHWINIPRCMYVSFVADLCRVGLHVSPVRGVCEYEINIGWLARWSAAEFWVGPRDAVSGRQTYWPLSWTTDIDSSEKSSAADWLYCAQYCLQIWGILSNTLGLDRYYAGARNPILLAAAVPIPILEMTSPMAWGKRTLHMLHILYVCFKTYRR